MVCSPLAIYFFSRGVLDVLGDFHKNIHKSLFHFIFVLVIMAMFYHGSFILHINMFIT